jgi:multiple sugar transport system substrate-binding protein
MVEIEFSVLTNPSTAGWIEQVAQDFETQTGIRVRVQQLSWQDAWSEIVKYALYKHGPDISEIGSTWLGVLVEMDALHPFSSGDVQAMGGREAFLPAAWQSCTTIGSEAIWAAPWLADTRFLYYRIDLLEQAGIDPAGAFRGSADLLGTLKRLKEHGVAVPWAIPTHRSNMTLHNVAAWVWGAGGNFLSPDGKSVWFGHPEAITGFQQYFDLGKFLNPEARELDDTQSDALFWSGQAAMTVSGPWLLREPRTVAHVLEHTGITFPPGVPFVGGSNLVIWKHTRWPREALSFVRFLTSQHMQKTYLPGVGLLPTRLDVLGSAIFSEDPIYRHVGQGLQIGRSFRLLPLWGLVEDRLGAAMSMIWAEVLRRPEADLHALIEGELTTLAQRLDLTLGSR